MVERPSHRLATSRRLVGSPRRTAGQTASLATCPYWVACPWQSSWRQPRCTGGRPLALGLHPGAGRGWHAAAPKLDGVKLLPEMMLFDYTLCQNNLCRCRQVLTRHQASSRDGHSRPFSSFRNSVRIRTGTVLTYRCECDSIHLSSDRDSPCSFLFFFHASDHISGQPNACVEQPCSEYAANSSVHADAIFLSHRSRAADTSPHW